MIRRPQHPRSRARAILLLTATALALLPLAAPANTLQPLSIDDLIQEADLVVDATVQSRTCRSDNAGRIYTEVTLHVLEVWKGSLPHPELTVVHGGGVLGIRKVTVSNQVHYPIGKRVIAFLIRNANGEAVTVGLRQGRFDVRTEKNGQVFVSSPHHGTGRTDRSPTLLPPEERPITLADLKARVTAAGKPAKP